MAQHYFEDIKKNIEEANLVVVGLGEEWNVSSDAKAGSTYQRVMDDLQAHPDYQWLLPYFYYKLTDEKLKKAYRVLFQLLEGKNYYVVATTVNRSFAPFVRDERFVMPCGNEKHMCDDALSASEEHIAFVKSLNTYFAGEISFGKIAFVRDEEGQAVPFNNIYAPGYKEEGYLPQWSKYMSWLQGTMNRNVCLLELGAGLQFPSVIRFPFEKMAYFNQKATCFRVHKTLYHLTEEMAERSVSVPMNAVDLFSSEDK